SVRRRVGRRQLRQRGSQLRVGGRIDLSERRRVVSDLPVRSYHEKVAVVDLVAARKRAVRPAHGGIGVAREQERKLGVARPRLLRGVDVGADRDEYDVVATLEQLRVLITVRVHLNRSAPCSRLIEEREHDRLPLEITEVNRLLEQPEAGGGGQREVRRHGSDVEGFGLVRRGLLRQGRCGRGERQRGEQRR